MAKETEKKSDALPADLSAWGLSEKEAEYLLTGARKFLGQPEPAKEKKED